MKHSLQDFSLTLQAKDQSVEGDYECIADNGIKKPVSQVITLTVEYPPTIQTERVSIII